MDSGAQGGAGGSDAGVKARVTGTRIGYVTDNPELGTSGAGLGITGIDALTISPEVRAKVDPMVALRYERVAHDPCASSEALCP